MSREQWIEKVLDSATGIKRADPGPQVYDQVMNRFRQRKPVPLVVFVRWVAAAVFLVALNAGTVYYYAHTTAKRQSGKEVNTFASEILSDNSYSY